MKRTIVLTGLLMLAGAARATVTQDADGWTVVTPSPDSRIIYVSAGSGLDTNTGLDDTHPVKTLSKGVSLLRDGMPDHLLLKSGDVWNETFPDWRNNGKSGRSAAEPLLISNYGSGARPRINIGTHSGFTKLNDATTTRSHIFIIGLDFWGNLQDPADPNFDVNSPYGLGIFWLDAGDDLLVEDCKFGYCAIVFETNNGYLISNLRLRRNIIADGYNTNPNGFVEGAFFAGINGLLMEENLFDHNGWNAELGANATMFNHNFYVNQCLNVIVRRNLIFRAASLNAKFRSDVTDGEDGVLVDNNLIFEGELGISLDGMETAAPLKFQNFSITNNVLLNIDKDEAPGWHGFGWGIQFMDTYNGLIAGNLVVNQTVYPGNSYGIDLERTTMSSVTVRDNLLYRVAGQGIVVDAHQATAGSWQNILITSNAIQAAEVNAGMIAYMGALPNSAVAFSSNTYYTTNSAGWAQFNGADKNYAYWQSLNWDTGSTNRQITYPDPLRDLTSYQKMLTGNPATTELDFIVAARAQSKTNWHPEYTAAAVNDYIRSGFGRPPLGTPPSDTTPPTAPTISPTPIVSSTSVTLSWSASTDNPGGSGVAGYRVYRDGKLVGSPAGTSFTDATAAPSKTYNYTVTAFDASWNASAASTPLTVTTPAAPAGGGTGGGTTASSVTLLETAVFPNPAVGKDPTIRAFVGNADELEITIYDAAGSVVHSDLVAGGPTGTASNGKPFYDYVWTGKKSSGVYYAVIHGKKGGEVVRARVKFAVVR
jgi:hypothetical protein